MLRARQVGINISYRLGNLKAQLKKTAKSILNDDVIQGEKNSSTSGNQQ